MTKWAALLSVTAAVLTAQQAPPASTFSYRANGDEKAVEIANVAYRVTQLYQPRQQWVVLRTTLRSRQILDDKGWESKIRLEAWPLGTELTKKPLYSVEAQGSEAGLLGGELWQVLDNATDPDVPVWSVYRVETGLPVFQSFVAPVTVRVELDPSLQTFEDRYAGVYVPPDDAPDVRLRDKHVVAVITCASAAGLLAEALLTADDAARAKDLRSYWDTERHLTVIETPPGIELRFKPATPVRIPISKNGLDLRRASLPAGLHLAAWKR